MSGALGTLPLPLGGTGAGSLRPVVRDTKLDADGDVARGPTDTLMTSKREAIAQAIGLALSLQGPGVDPDSGVPYDGEWEFDGTIGVDWWGKILVKAPDLVEVRAIIGGTIRGVAGVTGIRELGLVFDANRKLTINYSASSDVGIIEGTKVVG